VRLRAPSLQQTTVITATVSDWRRRCADPNEKIWPLSYELGSAEKAVNLREGLSLTI
jgi:hypothetical protein